ncbi:DUF262 domain-containing protein [Cyanobacterium aponinum UTEX 3222]|uniref:DUF262 domain-containing protein n=1 Tax=Cyanobacterium aponinum 0216 TaxID=2676140 RepID=A0A844GRG6_9CHRO|nr:DUF262 domain-containing protein [Cyanobacterium aponinum]MTF39077.1 DUF262 domain-containing protein [Cyanobacterium aponinum 0216]WRL41389.1 DUF262 domain-containing protein [Cyanobacterium aponinum UTEX 3222]
MENTLAKPKNLQEEIDQRRQEIRTDGYSMSIGELMSLYENKEINIYPDFQRFFRWTEYQKSTFIESILLGIPIPAIFVSQRDDGVWDVVDGVQRLSTIYEFAGILNKQKDDEIEELIALQKTIYLPSLQGKKWNDPNDLQNSLTSTQRLLIKRAKIAVNIVQKESDPMIKYELFQRLNMGGSIAKPQEVRNCILVMLNKKLFELIRNLANYEPFKNCVALSDRLYEEQYDMELVLRFVLLFDRDEEKINQLSGEVSEFLTNEMREMALKENLDYEKIERAFKTTFHFIDKTTGEDTFKKYKVEQERFLGGFLLSPFEVIALGIGYNYKQLPAENKMYDLIKQMWLDSTYLNNYGAGINAKTRFRNLIPLGRKLFASS